MRIGVSGVVALALAIATAMVGTNARGAEPLKIRLGWIVAPASLSPIFFEHAGLARHAGTSYVIESLHFQGTPPMITGLASGELDVAPLSPSAFGLAIVNAGMDDLRVFADQIQDGVPGYNSNAFMALQDGPVRSIDDLKGKVLATNAIASASDIAMRTMLRRHHLEEKRDYTIIEASFPTMTAMLADKKADLVTAVLPFSLDPRLQRIGRTVFTQADALGTTQLTAWVARAGFLERNHAALVDFMEDAVRAIRWYLDPANRAEAIGYVARFTKQPPENFAAWAFTKGDQYRDPDARPNLDALQKNLVDQKEIGFLKSDIDVRSHSDLGIVEEALRRVN